MQFLSVPASASRPTPLFMKWAGRLQRVGVRIAAMCAALGCAAVLAAAPARPASAASAANTGIEGVISRITDGDSLWLQPTGKAPIEVRLRDIDAPEICQAWGPEAKRALIDLALNKTATLRLAGRDPRGHPLGVLIVDEVNIGQRMVEEGHAWSLRGRNDTGPLVKQERMAKALGRGLHAGGAAVKPTDFRRTHGPCAEGVKP